MCLLLSFRQYRPYALALDAAGASGPGRSARGVAGRRACACALFPGSVGGPPATANGGAASSVALAMAMRRLLGMVVAPPWSYSQVRREQRRLGAEVRSYLAGRRGGCPGPGVAVGGRCAGAGGSGVAAARGRAAGTAGGRGGGFARARFDGAAARGRDAAAAGRRAGAGRGFAGARTGGAARFATLAGRRGTAGRAGRGGRALWLACARPGRVARAGAAARGDAARRVASARRAPPRAAADLRWARRAPARVCSVVAARGRAGPPSVRGGSASGSDRRNAGAAPSFAGAGARAPTPVA